MESRHETVRRLSARLALHGTTAKRNRLFALVDEGRCGARLAQDIVEALGPSSGEAFREALARSKMRSSSLGGVMLGTGPGTGAFEPHLWVLHERARPKTLFPVTLTGLAPWKRVPLPAPAARQSWQRQWQLVRESARRHYREHGCRDGLFGRATGYVYCPDPDHSYRVSTTGRPETLNLGPREPGGRRFSLRVR